MKKFLGILFALLFLLTFAACDGRADQRKVDEVYDWLQIGVSDNLTNESPRIIMPTEKDGVTITWSIDKPEYISSSGVITQPSHEVGDQVVTIIATITLNKASRTKTFTGTVKALPPVTETPPLLEENFKSYNDGDIEPQTNRWAVVSGKTGTSKFTVVSSIGGVQIPGGSKALKVEAFTERTLETSIRHDYDFLVIEADLMQTADSGGSPINLQSSYSEPVVAFGLDGKKLYYRVDNGQQPGINVELNKWYRARLEIDLVNKTIELFYYQDGQLIAVTPEEKVTFNGTTSFQSFFIRTGSKNTTELKPPAYITNIVINRLEALPRPEEKVKLGEITGIENLNISQGSAFTPATPKVYNYYGSRRELVKDTDYTLEITNPVNTEVPGEYTVVYRFVNKSDSNDVKEVIQTVTVYSEVEPNQIQDVTSTLAMPHDWKTTVTITLVQPAGKLYYYLSKNETETKETVMTGTQVDVTSETVTLEDLSIGENTYLHIVVEHNGYVQTAHELNRITVVEISTPQEFYDMTQLSQANQAGKYFLLKADLDFANFEWQQVGQKFYGILDGDGHVISNLTINSPASVYGGIFGEIDGATIKNLVFENVNIISGGERSAVITGQAAKGSKSTIENITIIDSKVTIGDSTTRSSEMYGGLIIGRVRGEAVVRNVKVEASEVYVIGKYVGGLVGYVESGSLSLYDVDAEIKVTEESDNPQLVGGIVGRTKSGSTLYMERIVAKVDLSGTKNIGGLIGKNESTAFIKDALITGKLTYTASSSGAICGNNAGTLNSENVWVVALTGESESGNLVTVPAEFKIESIDTVSVSSWWITNMPNIANSELWDVEGFAMLKREEVEKFTVTFVAEGVTIDPVQVRSGGKVTLPTPEKEGYEFKGWFTDSDFTTPFNPDTPITEDLTLYALFEEITVPQYKVTFNSNGGSEVAEQTVLEGEKAVKPADPTREGYEFAGWFTDEELKNEFDFDTEITANITLYAKWEPLFKVSLVLNGGIAKLDGKAVTELYVKSGEVLPTLVLEKPLNDFAGWFTDEGLTTAFDLETAISQNLTLYAKWEETEAVIEIGTAEDFVAFLNNPGLNKYVLTSDLDMAGQTYVAQIFSGILDGQGHVIRNLSYNGGDRSGLFTYLRGIVRNIVFENASITSSGRAGLIAGEIDVTGVVIDNIVVKNLTVTGNQENGVGGLVAVIKDGSGSASFSNIYMKNVTIVNTGQKNAGALVAYARGKEATVIRDIQLIDVSVKATEHAGGLIGCVKTTLPVTMERVVLENVKVEASNYAAGIIGRLNDSGYKDVTLSSAFIKGLEIICSGSYKNAVTGRYSDMGLASVFGGEFTIPSTSNGQTVQTLITDFDALDQDWFEENLPALTADPWSIVKGWPVLFSFPEDEAMPIIEVVGQPDNTAVKVAGTVIFLHKNGFFISDGTGAIYVFRYPTDADLKAKILPGAKVFLDGKLVIYNGLPEISDYTLTVLKEAPATGFDYQFAAPDAILTEIALAETNNPYAYGRILHVQGKIVRSGNYFHLVDENFDVRVSFDNNHPQEFLDEIPAFEGKLVKVTVLTYDFISSSGIWRVLGAPGSVQEIETYIYDDADLVAAIAAKLKSVLENTPVTQDLELPTLGVNDATIAWTSSHPDIIGNDGTFNAPAEDTEVELTAKVTLGTAEKEVVIKVIAKKAAVSSGTPVIISQAYGGGGNSGAKYKNDFIELYNTTDEDIDLTGWVVFYASKNGDFSKSNNMYIILSGTIKAKSFFLIQAAAGSGGIENLPTPDAVCGIAMAGSDFKLALCNSDTLPTGPDSPNVVDFVGAGSANAYEGSGPAPAPSNPTAIVRPNLLDTDDNSVDFETAAPNPRNSAYVLE